MYGDTACLTIDLAAVAANWRRLADLHPGTDCAAVVKADAYGLGAARTGPALWRAGCRRFFVAHAEEALSLRRILPEAAIHTLHGVAAGAEGDLQAAGIIPVLSTPEQVARWAAEAGRLDRRLPAVLQVDTGINRLGLQPGEFVTLTETPSPLAPFDLQFIMSHLACADTPENPLNAEQLRRFSLARARLPGLAASLANSAGCFLGPDYRHDILRPGIALYGGNPVAPTSPAPHHRATMLPVVKLEGRILQIRDIDRSESVGYGATYRVEKPARIATVAVGYADGFLRALSNHGQAAIAVGSGHVQVPIAGRVSMDMITLDITALASGDCRPGQAVTLLGGPIDLDTQAAAAGTISYELLTSLGARYARVYTGETA